MNLVLPNIAGNVDRVHLEIPEETKAELKKAMESPLTECAKLPIAYDKADEHVTWYKASAPKLIDPIAGKRNALWTGHPYEHPYFPPFLSLLPSLSPVPLPLKPFAPHLAFPALSGC